MNVNEIKNLLYDFWQQTSDACPLEVSESEKQEKAFSEFVENKFKDWSFEDASSFMMKWLSEKKHPHTMVKIESNRVTLWESQKVHIDDSFLLD